MTLGEITTREELQSYLYAALQLEHATIPPYLVALYSMHPGKNSDAYNIIRAVLVEEMLHLTLVANIMNAVGGSPDLTTPGFVPTYPTHLPDGEDDFTVDLRPFSMAAIDTFLKIERPAKAPDEQSRLVESPAGVKVLGTSPTAPGMHFYSIGEFYAEIDRGISSLAQTYGDDLFCGDPQRQVGPEYFYSGGGEIVPVTDLASAQAAVRQISEQGEGYSGGIYDEGDEIAHYYRFQQLKLGRYYLHGDKADAPTGPALAVDWNAVYQVKVSARLTDYPKGSELETAAEEFNRDYAGILRLITQAYNGAPQLLHEAVWAMFRLRNQAIRLIHNPIDGRHGVHASPTFEMTETSGVLEVAR